MVSLCSPGCPGTHSVDQAGLELRNPPASASRVLGLKQRSPRTRPWPLGLSAPTLLFLILWPFVVQWLFRQFRTQKR
ncbi:Acyl-Coenzyme A-binding domain-containing 4 [Apodemus speciosus]|uniref:Acyl-Coenzyme A-binding domain-containing 4 n=1 Tax=Apodemus speciosus TaxID=105296 RepID=A0ABQ0FCE2_APOSI